MQVDDPAGDGESEAGATTTILGLVGAVLALFVVSQLVALTDAGDRLIESAGLTPAEYARSGFFQLCWATGLLLAFLAVVRMLADPAALQIRAVVFLGAAVPALALGLVVVSLRRMALYDDAFGLTMLRLAVVVAAVWMGTVLVMTAARSLGVGSGRDWLVAGAGAAGVALIVLANLANPEAFVARHNLDRAQDGAELDVGYLATLSDDAVPEIVDTIEGEADPTLAELLLRAVRCGADADGVAMLNLATRRAAEVREELCRAALRHLHGGRLRLVCGHRPENLGLGVRDWLADHALRPSVEVGVNRADDSTHLAECILLPGREDRSNRHVAKVQVFEWS